MKKHSIDLKILDEVLSKKARCYESQKKIRKKFKYAPKQIRTEHKFYPLLEEFRNLYYQRYEQKGVTVKHYGEGVGEYLTMVCDEGHTYRPGEFTIFKFAPPPVFKPNSEDPILDLDEPTFSSPSENQNEVIYTISGKIGMIDIDLQIKKH